MFEIASKGPNQYKDVILSVQENPTVEIKYDLTTVLSPQWDFIYWQYDIFILNQGPDLPAGQWVKQIVQLRKKPVQEAHLETCPVVALFMSIFGVSCFLCYFQGSVNFKFGVLYARDGQMTDDEMYSNGKSEYQCLWQSPEISCDISPAKF